ncbi:hypothetical protein MKA40_15280 [[Clostridium] innocuum]|nr:hypothetical protein [[Clostridium] innocuum]MCR0289676.1 hypothetical protein [[Clostridium] innocuum]MCR0437844.1 hypothetical protein [[Clostridium] innocuum]
MGKCINCGHSTGLFSSSNICKTCKNYFITDVRFATNDINRISEDINRGFKNLDSYLSRFIVILDCYKRIEKAKKMIPDIISVSKTYDEYVNDMNLIISEYQSIKLSEIGMMKTEKGRNRNYEKEYEKVAAIQYKYPIFNDAIEAYLHELLDRLNGHIESMTDINEIKFDKKIRSNEKEGECYTLKISSTKKIVTDILFLNHFIEEASHITGKHFFKVNPMNITFNYNHDDYNSEKCTYVRYNPKTATGKPSKYPYEIVFDAGIKSTEWNKFGEQEVFGTLSYTPDLQIGKSRIVCWLHGACYVLNVVKKDGELLLNRIYELDSETGRKNIIYEV